VTSRRVLGICIGISWLSGVLLFLVKEYRRILYSVFGLSILRKFCWVFSPMRVSQDIMSVSIASLIESLSMNLFIQLMY
jgi:hypothetical protein